MSYSILIIDDNISLLNSLRILLKTEFDPIEVASHPDKVVSAIAREHFDIILLDMNFRPGQTDGNEGMYWLSKFIQKNPDSVIILMTAFGDVELAIEGIKKGAFDFIQKPWKTEKLITTLQAGCQLTKSRADIRMLKQKNQARNQDLNQTEDDFIGQSSGMKQVFTTIGKIAKTDATVLISGENGTGKELVAREIHRSSMRCNGPFVPVDMGALNENLFESELFGHKKNAFTGATQDRIGRFQYASGGSLFMDEIGNLSMDLQAKLLRVIQDQSIQPVGSNETISTDIRLILASNINLRESVAKGTFREDLFYRINTIEMEMPPLRQRQSDIPVLSNYFLQKYAKKYQKSIQGFDQECLKVLCDYPWPGNVRELKHSIERAVILSDHSVLSAADFLLQPVNPGYQIPESLDLEDVEKRTISMALEKYPQNLSKVALALCISRTTLYAKIKKYGLQ